MLKSLHGIVSGSAGGIIPWDLNSASYDNVAFAHGVSAVYGVFFRPDGLRIYLCTFGNMYQFTLGTAWDLSTVTTSGSVSFNTAGQDNFPHDLFFSTDGLKMYMVGAQNSRIYQYPLSVAWDLSTATTVGLVTSPVLPEGSFPSGAYIRSDGLKLYTSADPSIWQYTFGTAWDISTVTYDSVTFNVSGTPQGTPETIFFKPDGLEMFVLGSTPDAVGQYTLGTAWDLSTATLVGLRTFSVVAQEGDSRGLYFKPDGTKMYMGGTFTVPRNIYQYTL